MRIVFLVIILASTTGCTNRGGGTCNPYAGAYRPAYGPRYIAPIAYAAIPQYRPIPQVYRAPIYPQRPVQAYRAPMPVGRPVYGYPGSRTFCR